MARHSTTGGVHPAGASRIQVMIYPGIVSQVVNGLDGLLRMPFG